MLKLCSSGPKTKTAIPRSDIRVEVLPPQSRELLHCPIHVTLRPLTTRLLTIGSASAHATYGRLSFGSVYSCYDAVLLTEYQIVNRDTKE